MIRITSSLTIPRRELQFAYSTSGGPGGQHANKVSTRVTLLFDVQNSPSLRTYQKLRILKHCKTRINKSGVMRVVSSKHRSQRANKETTVDRFSKLLIESLTSKKTRKKSRVPVRSKIKRLDEKRKRADLKRLRKDVKLGNE